MKHSVLVLLLLMFFVNFDLAAHNNVPYEIEEAGKKCIKASAGITNETVEISVTMTGDNTSGYYALKKSYSNGRFETVAYKKIEISDSPQTYHFKDENINSGDCTYVLMRIFPETKKFEVVEKWKFSAATKEVNQYDSVLSSLG